MTKIFLTQDTQQHPTSPEYRLETLLPGSKPVGTTAFQLAVGFGQPPGGVYVVPLQPSLSCVLPVNWFSLDSVPALRVPRMLWRCQEINTGLGDSGTT